MPSSTVFLTCSGGLTQVKLGLQTSVYFLILRLSHTVILHPHSKTLKDVQCFSAITLPSKCVRNLSLTPLARGPLPLSLSLCWYPWISASLDVSSPSVCLELECAHIEVCFIPKVLLVGQREQHVGGQLHKCYYFQVQSGAWEEDTGILLVINKIVGQIPQARLGKSLPGCLICSYLGLHLPYCSMPSQTV